MDTTLPSPLEGPLVWSGEDLAETDYVINLTDSEMEEAEKALKSFKTLGLDGDRVLSSNFPLPELGARLQQFAQEVHDGRGFVVLRGLGKVQHTVEDATLIYLGISSYFGDLRGMQDRKRNMLTHVTNSKQWKTPTSERHGIHSNEALPFHNDMGCDMLALQARQVAEKGGFTYLSSGWTVLNRLLHRERDQEIVKTLLSCSWPVQVSNRSSNNFYLAPAATIHEGRLMFSMDPNRFGPHPSSKSVNIPDLTPAQRIALERVSEVAGETEVALSLRQGDLLFFNNWALLHRRDAYEDAEETSRHLVRLWLRNTQLGWSVPPSMMTPWSAAFGKSTQVGMKVYSVYPQPVYHTPKYSAGSAAFIVEDSDDDIKGPYDW